MGPRGVLGALLLLLAGCGEPPADTGAEGEVPEPAKAFLPRPMHAEDTLSPGASPVYSWPPDCAPPTGSCVRYPFLLPRDSTVTVFMQWLLAAEDIEVYVVDQDSQERLAGSNAAETRMEFLRVTLPPGSYELLVTATTNGQTPYELWAWFDEPADPAHDLANSTDR